MTEKGSHGRGLKVIFSGWVESMREELIYRQIVFGTRQDAKAIVRPIERRYRIRRMNANTPQQETAASNAYLDELIGHFDLRSCDLPLTDQYHLLNTCDARADAYDEIYKISHNPTDAEKAEMCRRASQMLQRRLHVQPVQVKQPNI